MLNMYSIGKLVGFVKGVAFAVGISATYIFRDATIKVSDNNMETIMGKKHEKTEAA